MKKLLTSIFVILLGIGHADAVDIVMDQEFTFNTSTQQGRSELQQFEIDCFDMDGNPTTLPGNSSTTTIMKCQTANVIDEAIIVGKSSKIEPTPEPVTTTPATPPAPKPEQPKLSEADSQARINELRDNADAMKDKEQSNANKILGGAAIGLAGAGANMAFQGAAYQNADKDAEAAMREYVSTFRCEYGMGRARGGEMNVELPGGNELIGLYTEYIDLARDVKRDKEALGLAPGIESETVFDKATSGLYDDDNIGSRSGGTSQFSMARAIADPNSEDAKAWAKQQSDSKKQLTTGAVLAGAGVVGGIVGDALINTGGKNGKNIFGQDVVKEDSAGINAKYDKLRKTSQTLKTEIEKTPTPADAQSGEKVDAAGVTQISLDTPAPTEQEQVVAVAQQEVQTSIEQIKKDTPVSDSAVIQKTLCEAVTCNEHNNYVLNGVNFDFDKHTIKPDADTDLQKVAGAITDIQRQLGNSDIIVTVTGHTDSIGSFARNNQLSQDRANSVKDKLVQNGIPQNLIIASGQGSKKPIQSNSTAQGRAANRRVEIQISSATKTASTTPISLDSVVTTIGKQS